MNDALNEVDTSQDPNLIVEPRRIVKFPFTLKSPYVQREVSVQKRLTSNKRKIATYMFSITGNEFETMFIGNTGEVACRGVMESLRPGCLYNPTEKLLGDTESSSTLIADFKLRMTFELSDNNVPHNLHGVDMVFHPIMHGTHWYVISFDLRLAKTVIIDNSGASVPNLQKYRNVPVILTVCREIFLQTTCDRQDMQRQTK